MFESEVTLKLINLRKEANKLLCKLWDISETMGEDYNTDLDRWPGGWIKRIALKLADALGVYCDSHYGSASKYDKLMDAIAKAKSELTKHNYEF